MLFLGSLLVLAVMSEIVLRYSKPLAPRASESDTSDTVEVRGPMQKIGVIGWLPRAGYTERRSSEGEFFNFRINPTGHEGPMSFWMQRPTSCGSFCWGLHHHVI